MGVQTCVSGSSRQTLSVFVGNVLASPRVSVSFGEPKVNDVHVVLPLAETHQEVVRLNISVQVKPRVYVLDALDHLVRKHQHCLERELPATLSEQFLQAATESVHHHHISFFVLAEPMNLRNSNAVM